MPSDEIAPPLASIFLGKKDDSTDATRKTHAAESFLRIQRKNPGRTIRDGKGFPVTFDKSTNRLKRRAPAPSLLVPPSDAGDDAQSQRRGNSRRAPTGEAAIKLYRTAPLPHICRAVRKLEEKGKQFDSDEEYNHDPGLALQSQQYASGRTGEQVGSVLVAGTVRFHEDTLLASRAGTYLVDGALVYMHTDGSIARFADEKRELQCRCRCHHVA